MYINIENTINNNRSVNKGSSERSIDDNKHIILEDEAEKKLDHFIKLNHFLNNENVKDFNLNEYENYNVDDSEVDDKILLQLKDLEKETIKPCPVVYFNNHQIPKNEASKNFKKKHQQGLSIKSMMLTSKANNITGLEDKDFNIYNDSNSNYLDLDDRLRGIDE